MKVWDQVDAANHIVKVVQLPAGRLNAANASEIKGELLGLLADPENQNPDVVLDMTQVTFVDSIGMSVLISLLRHCTQNQRKLKLAAVQPQAKPTFDILEMTQVFKFYETVGEAISDKDINSDA